LPNDKGKSQNLTEKKTWLLVASKWNEKYLNCFIKGRKCTDYCIELPRLCFKAPDSMVQT
jgi:hypothetical protein